MSTPWIPATIESLALPDAAAALGFTPRHGAVGPCPLCGAERRGRSDSRPPVDLRGDGRHWFCVRCREGGDVVNLASAVLLGERKPSTSEGWATVRQWAASMGVREAVERDGPGAQAARPRPAPMRAPKGTSVIPIQRLPAGEVAALVRASVSCASVPEVARWLRSRAERPATGPHDLAWGGADAGWTDPAALVDLHRCARALPSGVDLPDWAWCSGRPWSRGWRLLLPCYNPRGRLVGLRARWADAEWNETAGRLVEVPPVRKRKEVAPRGSGVLRGTVYADTVGRWLLKHGPGATNDGRWDGRVLVMEGGPDFLWAACHPSKVATASDGRWYLARPRPAVFGVWAGAWRDDLAGHQLASRLVRAELVTIATDPDDAGNRYARKIAATLDHMGVRWARTRGGEA